MRPPHPAWIIAALALVLPPKSSGQSTSSSANGVGIVTGRPGRVYDDVGRGLAALFQDRLPNLFGSGTAPEFEAVSSTFGSVENAKQVATPGGSRTTRLPIRGGKESRFILSREGDESLEIRLGLVNSFALVPIDSPADPGDAYWSQIRGLAVLWDDYLHLVVAPHVVPLTAKNGEVERPLGFETLESRRGKGKGRDGRLLLHIGGKGSATRVLARAILDGSPLDGAFEEAALIPGKDLGEALAAGEIDAAFILSGLPDADVEQAMTGGCHLLPIENPLWNDATATVSSPGWSSGPVLKNPTVKRRRLIDLLFADEPRPIYKRAYPGLDVDIPTLVSSTILIASHAAGDAFTDDQARAIVRAVFETANSRSGLERLLDYHEAAQDVRLLTNLREWRRPPSLRQKMLVPFHPGAENFFEAEDVKLKIAAGPAGSTSFRVGNAIAESLSRRDIHARAFTTDGTKESCELLMAEPAVVDLAILQNDVAVANHVSGQGPSLVTFLYPEVFHFIVREGAVGEGPASLREYMERDPNTRRIAMVKNSGDLDEMILTQYARVAGREIELKDLPYLPVAVAQSRLISGEIDAALIGSGIPMASLETFLGGRVEFDEEVYRLRAARITHPPGVAAFSGLAVLPLDLPEDAAKAREDVIADKVPSLLGLAANEAFLSPYTIPSETYPGVQRGAGATVAVQTILACRDDVRGLNVYNAVSALIDDEVRLRREARGLNLRDPLERGEPSVPIHPDALRYYRAKNFVVRQPEPERTLWENALRIVTGQAMGILAGVFATILVQVMSTNARDWLQSWIEGKNPANQLARDSMLIYFGTGEPLEKMRRLDEKRAEIGALLRQRKVRPNQVDHLDKMLQDYRKQLRTDLDDQIQPS